jgi:hypothetical protein
MTHVNGEATHWFRSKHGNLAKLATFCFAGLSSFRQRRVVNSQKIANIRKLSGTSDVMAGPTASEQ